MTSSSAISDRFRLMGPDETVSNRLGAVFERTDRAWDAMTRPGDDRLGLDGRVLQVLSSTCARGGWRGIRPPRAQGWLDVSAALERESGLLGLAGSGDMRAVEAAADRGDADAQLGLDVYLHRLAGSIAAMTASLGGIDVLAFTAGTGQHSAGVRRGAVQRLGYLGVAIGEGNGHVTDDADVSTPTATVRTVVVAAREDLQLARETRRVRTHSSAPTRQ